VAASDPQELNKTIIEDSKFYQEVADKAGLKL